jgi:hypothetical protein
VTALEASSHQEQIHSHLPSDHSCGETGFYGPVLRQWRQESLKHLESCLDTAETAGARSYPQALLPGGSGMGFELTQPLVPSENSP